MLWIYFFSESNMADAQLAKSIFSRKPDEETIVADVYTSTGDSSVNSFQDISGSSTDLLDSVSFLSKFNSAKNLIGGPTIQNAEALKGNITDALGNSTSSAKSLVGDLMSKAKTAMSSVGGATSLISGTLRTGSDAYTQIGGLVKAVKSGNLKDLRNVTNTLNAITGKTSVLLSANGAVGKIYGTVVDQAGAAGMSDSFKLVSDAVRDSNTLVNKGSILYTMAGTALPGAVGRGDVRGVASMVDSLGSGSISMMKPNAVSKLAANFKEKLSPAEIGGANGQFVQYAGAYQKIDPNWTTSAWKPLGSTAEVKDLSKLLDASSATKNLFATGARMNGGAQNRFFCALDAFGSKPNVSDSIRQNFPMSTAPNSTTTQMNDSDPRVPAVPRTTTSFW